MKKNVWIGIGTTYYMQIDNSRLESGKPRDGVADMQGRYNASAACR